MKVLIRVTVEYLPKVGPSPFPNFEYWAADNLTMNRVVNMDRAKAVNDLKSKVLVSISQSPDIPESITFEVVGAP